MSTSDPRIGTIVGNYRVEAVLGRGGMGVVYRAEDQRPGTRGRKVALKILNPELSTDERFRQRFERESQTSASLDHPNIVPVYEAGEVDGLVYIAMRHVEGHDLGALLGREGALAPDRAVAIVAQVGAALDAAHARGLVHRDVKPGNILLVPADDPDAPPHVYLTDFGLTKRTTSRSGLTVTGQFVGTIEYVAPEQIEGKEVDHRTDVYALGCVLFETLTGLPPYQADQDAAMLWAHLTQAPPKPSEARPGLPPALDDVIARALAKSKEDRQDSCRELVAAARAALRGAPPRPTTPARPSVAPPAPPGAAPPAPPRAATARPPPAPAAPAPPTPPPAWRPPARRPRALWAWIAGGAAALVVVGVVVAVALGGGPDNPPPPPRQPFPDAAESALLARISPELQTPACTRGTRPQGSDASVDCFTETPQLLYYTHFRDPPSMGAAYDEDAATSGVPRGTGNCAEGEPAEDSWLDPDEQTSGRLLCYSDSSGTAIIVWTHDELQILAEARRPDGDLRKLYNFWTGIADYV